MPDNALSTEAAVYFAAIVDSSDDAIVSKNFSGIIQTWNKAAERIFGYAAQEEIGQPILLIIPPDLHHEGQTILTRLRKGERIEHFETVRRRKDGALIHISLTISPVRDAERQAAARKQAEARQRRWSSELEQQVRERTHELVRSQERLRGLATQLSMTEQRERRRLASELHDHLQQLLVLAKMQIGQGKRFALDLPPCECVLKKADEVLSEALTYTRTPVADLSPPVLRDHGLSAGLKWLGESMTKHDLVVTVRVDDRAVDLPEVLPYCCFSQCANCSRMCPSMPAPERPSLRWQGTTGTLPLAYATKAQDSRRWVVGQYGELQYASNARSRSCSVAHERGRRRASVYGHSKKW